MNNEENWDPEINNNVMYDVQTMASDEVNNNNTYRNDNSRFSGNSNVRSEVFEDWEGDFIDTKVDNVQNCVQSELESKDDTDSVSMRLPKVTDNVVYNYSIQHSVSHLDACDRDRSATPEPCDSMNCDKDFVSVETTPKASDRLADMIQLENDSSVLPPNRYVSNYSPYFPPVHKPVSSEGQNSQSSTRSTTPVNVNPQDCKITPVKDPWDILETNDNDKTASVNSYRNKRLDYDTCSSESRSKASDTDSVATSDSGVKDQEYAWELIEDLTDRLHDVVLDTGSSNRSSVAECEKNIEPVEVKESELQDVEKCTENENDISETGAGNDSKGKVILIRNPLLPSSILQVIWDVEETMPGGMYSAKGRRKMFRNYAICRELETVTDEASMIQYSIDELLRLGSSPLSRRVPETWSYLTTIYPDICFSEVSNFLMLFDYLIGNPLTHLAHCFAKIWLNENEQSV